MLRKNVDKLNAEIAAYQTLIEDTKNKWGNINPINVGNITDFATKQGKTEQKTIIEAEK